MSILLPGNANARPGRYAAIDIGTVTCRLLVADILLDGRFQEICRSMEICNLGVDVDETQRLNPEAIERVGVAVDSFMGEVKALEARDGVSIKVAAVATSASRDAKNSDEFEARLARAGVKLQVIPGMEEASLSFAGATCEFAGQKVVVLDIGGGSTEIVAGTAGDAPAFAHSFNVGCRRLAERYLRDDPATTGQIEDACDWVRSEMASYIGEVKAAGFFEGSVLAVAGTATSCVTMRDSIAEYDPNIVQGEFVSCKDVDDLIMRLAPLTIAERQEVVGLEPRRAEVIVAGLLILKVILELADVSGFTVSETDILHGIVLSLASSD